jgi:hydrogenase maturation protein HypF
VGSPQSTIARNIRVRGVVQGVGFRPFVFRLANANGLAGWVRNGADGVEIFLEGAETGIGAFLRELKSNPPPAASISAVEVIQAESALLQDFTIRESHDAGQPTTRVSPDLAVCDDCLRELFDPSDRRYHYPYINCTNCGPRYTILLSLPYDRCNTTMKNWPLDGYCSSQYHDPGDRRFHAQPVACPECGPRYALLAGATRIEFSDAAIREGAHLIREGAVLAVKGLGGYHLACDARNPAAVLALRERKYRKEKPFALMVRNLDVARAVVDLGSESETLLCSTTRPVVLCPARILFEGVAPETNELGIMLPYTPLQHLLFDAGAPDVLVMTSANRSDEPIAYEDADAGDRLSAIADAFLIGERPIARRVDDSVTRAGAYGPAVLRRARGYAPGAVAAIPSKRPILAVGADLKNTIALAVEGQVFVSQHIGDLDHYPALEAFQNTVRDFLDMYEVNTGDLLVVRDGHPAYASTAQAAKIEGSGHHVVQHHRAHISSVLAELGEWDTRVVGLSCDGTGYGDDGTIWGGEIFVGSVAEGFERAGHLRTAALPGGDAAARHPVQAAAGFLAQLENLPDLGKPPFSFPRRFFAALELVEKGVRTFATTSTGRLFDTAAAIAGFTREMSFEGQAAMWLENQARQSGTDEPYPFPFQDGELDFRPLLDAMMSDRRHGRSCAGMARAFHRGVAQGLSRAAMQFCDSRGLHAIVLSGGVFQNDLLLREMRLQLEPSGLQVWTNRKVPPNDGGISLGQVALAAFGRFDEH